MRLDSVRSAMARALAVLAVVACTVVSAAFAQGVTSASLRGRVLDEAGSPIDGAVVTATNVATGARYQGRTRAGGQFNIENLALGRYVIESRAIGYRPTRLEGTRLSLGQVADVELRMPQSAVELGAITVHGEEANPLISTSRTGASSYVSDSVILRLPTLNRNFTDFIQTVPQVVGTSVAGQNNRFNNIQIDGAVNNDLFGLAASGTPGGQANARPISVEAVREFQVLIAPFDVRQGGFTGGIVNVVTRSGTNEFRGSAFGYYQNNGLVSAFRDSTGLEYKPTDFNRYQYGFTLGGPIIRDRLHFFTVVDLSRRTSPFSTTSTIKSDTTGGADSVGIGVRWNTALRVGDILRDQYGFDPGTPGAPTLRNPDSNILIKLSGQLGASSHFDLSHNYVNASDQNLIRSPSTLTSYRDGYQLSNSGYDFQSITNTTRLNLSTTFGSRFTNELILGNTTVRDHRELPNRRPLIFVKGDRSGTVIASGADRFSHANSLDQDIFEITDNLTFPVQSHLITLGTHNEFFKFNNVFFPASLGVWNFENADSLARGVPYRYEIAVPGALRPDGPVADFSVKQWGFYAQDRWTPTRRLTLTMGVRYDVPSLGKPAYNRSLDSTFYVARGGTAASFDSLAVGGIKTNSMSLTGLFSPRLGFNYDVQGNGNTVVRGGAGIFTGRPAYVWVSNAFSNTGMEQATLLCDGAFSTAGGSTDTVPAFTVDPDNQPRNCGAGTSGTGATPPTPSIVYYDPDFKFPQTMRLAFGVDHQLPWGVVGTLDFLFTRAINQYYITDDNLRGIVGAASGEALRPMYGTISSSSGSATPTRITSRFRDVLRHRNESGDRSYSATVQLQKRFAGGMEFSAGYTLSQSLDKFTLGSSIASSNFRYTALDGTLDKRNLRRSVFDRPHRFVFSGAFNLPFQANASLRVTYQSGTPYAYVVSNDANADGQSGNDLVYVPMYSSDITLRTPSDWTALNKYINSEPCLNEQRGRIMERNSCRNPWQMFLDARVSKTISTLRGQSIEVSADFFNVPRLLGSVLDNDWGVVKETSGFEQANLLTLSGYSSGIGRGQYRLSLPIRERISIDASRWRMQFGVRYSF